MERRHPQTKDIPELVLNKNEYGKRALTTEHANLTRFLLSLIMGLVGLVGWGCRSSRPGTHATTDLAVGLSCMLDARAGPAVNSGRWLSSGEKLRAAFPGVGFLPMFCQAVGAAAGQTENQFAFERGLEPLGSANNVGLGKYLVARGTLAKGWYEHYLLATAISRHWTPEAVAEYCRVTAGHDYDLPRREWVTQWHGTNGPATGVCAALVEARALSAEDLRTQLEKVITSDHALPPTPRFLLEAERTGALLPAETNARLYRRFWILYSWALDDREKQQVLQGRSAAMPPAKLAVERALVRASLAKSTSEREDAGPE